MCISKTHLTHAITSYSESFQWACFPNLELWVMTIAWNSCTLYRAVPTLDLKPITSLLRPPDRPCCKFLLPSRMGRRLGILHFQEPPRLGLVWCWKNDLWNGCEMKAIAKQGEDSVTYSTLDLKLLKPWSLDHKIATGFQSHQDTLGSSGYSDSKTWGSRSAVDAPRFKAFGASSWFNDKLLIKLHWALHTEIHSYGGKQKPQRKSTF